jgi:integrase/recombinase XerD
MKNLKTAQELIEFAKASMKQTGYSEDYISALSNTWNALKQYLSRKSILHFSPSTGIAFLQDQYDIRSDYTYCKLSQVDKRRKWAILILNNCLEHETLIAPKSYSLCKFDQRFEKEFQRFIYVRRESGLSLSAINRDIYCLNKLSNYLDGLNIKLIEELESSDVIGFMKSLSVAGKLPTLNGAASSLRLVLKFLLDEHYISKDLSHFVPQVKCKPEGIPSVYTKDEIQQLLNSVDRTGPKGKRNYAIILLAARLGMRASDICGLTFDNLKWQTNTIVFIVKKTGVSAILPLLNEVGEAIIEYIKYGRPVSEDKHVFLRMQIPFVEMKPSVLHGIVSAGIRNANIPLLPGKRHGPHALHAGTCRFDCGRYPPSKPGDHKTDG